MKKKKLTKVQETETAFGGCKLCYGKGYSTVIFGRGNTEIRTCKCGRGDQIADMLTKVHKNCADGFFAEASGRMERYLEENFKRKQNRDNVRIMIQNYLSWLQKQGI